METFYVMQVNSLPYWSVSVIVASSEVQAYPHMTSHGIVATIILSFQAVNKQMSDEVNPLHLRCTTNCNKKLKI